ncbi:hypothetical protein AB3N59_06260 [Leptospira sp. WS92.C1]
MHLFPRYVLEKHFRILWILTALSSFFFCKPSSSAIGNNPYFELFANHKITQSGRYQGPEKNWETRISTLDSVEQNFIFELNKIDGFEDSPQPETDPEIWKNRLALVRKNLPASINSIMDQILLKVVFCRNLGGTGVSSFVYDSQRPIGGVVFLDTEMLNQTANDWITAKENSPFRSGSVDLKLKIERDPKNDIVSALEYILLHEVGHILSVTQKIVPDFRDKNRNFSKHEFSKGIWETETESLLDPDFPFRKRIRFYTKEPIDLSSNWDRIYPILITTPFPTLYSAMNGDDFFAESFVSYVHTILQNKIWNLELRQNKKKLFEMENGIGERRCKKQKEFLDRLFQKTR